MNYVPRHFFGRRLPDRDDSTDFTNPSRTSFSWWLQGGIIAVCGGLAAAQAQPHQEWVKRFNDTANNFDSIQAVATDNDGNVIVTGYGKNANSNEDYVTIKYNSAGQQLWLARYNGPANNDDRAAAIAVDAAGNVYVTGQSRGSNSGHDYATVKYSSQGAQLWATRYNGTANSDDYGASICVDASGNVFVTGTSRGGSSSYDYATVKYTSAGAQAWVRRYNGPANQEDRAARVAVDAAGNAYVTGKSKGGGLLGLLTHFDFATLKYDPNGGTVWTKRYDGVEADDEAVDLAVDASGNVFVTGKSVGLLSSYDYVTIKYSSSGSIAWLDRYNGPANGADTPTALALDAAGNVFVTGASRGNRGYLEFLTIRYLFNGTRAWVVAGAGNSAADNGNGSGEGTANALAVDAAGNVFVAGPALGPSGNYDYVTHKYHSSGGTAWSMYYNGPGNNTDTARAIALDPAGNLFVGGDSRGASGDQDYALVKYIQPEAPVILSQPASQTVNPGATVNFTVAAQGAPAPQYQWRLNGIVLPGATNATLTLTNVSPAQSGSYRVVVANIAGTLESAAAILTVNLPALPLADNFAGRALVNSLSGAGRGSNVGATVESGEPNHAGKNAARSVWITWRAPASGIATFTTAGSSVDTRLAVYTGASLTNLTLVAADDDSGGYYNARVVFNAQVGVDYQIAIDSPKGGDIVLSWDLEITPQSVPVITSISEGQTIGKGEDVLFAVDVNQTPVNYQWFFNGVPLPGATNASLSLTNVLLNKVGVYYVRIDSGSREILSTPVYLQINRTDDTVVRTVAARDKFLDRTVLAHTNVAVVAHEDDGFMIAAGGGTSRGYSTTQIFSTYGGGNEPGEPAHCGEPGGASAWFAYEAPADGVFHINTDGSGFDTVLAVYTGDGSSFESLVEVACDNNSGLDGQDSAVWFPGVQGTTYFIAVDGVGGASGLVVLNINLGDPPAIVASPQSQFASAGSTVQFDVDETGSEPMAYQWRFNGTNIVGATNDILVITNFQSNKAGNYCVVLSNLVNQTVSADATVTLQSGTINISAQPQSQTATEGADVTLNISATGAGSLSFQWRRNGENLAGATNAALFLPAVGPDDIGSYTVLLTDTNGSLISASAALAVTSEPEIVAHPLSQTAPMDATVLLSADAVGAPLLAYQWQFNDTHLPDATNASLTVSNFDADKQGFYRLVVTNEAGNAASSTACVLLGDPMRVGESGKNPDGTFQLQIIGLPTTNYVVKASTNLIDWVELDTVSSSSGFIEFTDFAATNMPARYYRAVTVD